MDSIKKREANVDFHHLQHLSVLPCGFEASQLLPDMFWSVSSAKNNEFLGLFFTFDMCEYFLTCIRN